MSIETVRVTPAKFPPTINTTPNSPRVCAKLSTAAVTTPGSDNGRITRQNVRKPPAPSTAEASSSFRSTPSNEAISGCTANGKLYSTDARISPPNVNASPCPKSAIHSLPIGPRATIDSSRNFPRQFEYASQYATGIPIKSNIAATHAANFIDNHKASIGRPFFTPLRVSSAPSASLRYLFFFFSRLLRKRETILRERGAPCRTLHKFQERSRRFLILRVLQDDRSLF